MKLKQDVCFCFSTSSSLLYQINVYFFTTSLHEIQIFMSEFFSRAFSCPRNSAFPQVFTISLSFPHSLQSSSVSSSLEMRKALRGWNIFNALKNIQRRHSSIYCFKMHIAVFFFAINLIYIIRMRVEWARIKAVK
jgi:hypothetical protein